MILHHPNIFKTAIIIVIGLTLSGCLKNISPFSQATNYRIEGIQDDNETQSYLQKILDERVVKDIDYKEGTEDFKRAEIVREETIASDLIKALKAKGYYDAQVDYIDDDSNRLEGTYNVNAGDLYTISLIKIEPEDLKDTFNFDIINEGSPLEALPVLNAQNRLYESLQKNNCYFSLDVQHDVVLDEKRKTAILTYNVDIGAPATFGQVVFEGQESVAVKFLDKLIPWKQGDCFRQEKIRDLRTTLLETGLFARVDTQLPETLNDDGVAPVTVKLKERVHRSVKAGVSYYTDEALGTKLGWEHRNFFGNGEKLQTELNLNQINQSLDANFIKPFFLRKDQSLEINSALRTQETDAFDETAFDIGANIKRQFHKRLSGSTGIELSFSEIEDDNDRRTYGLVSFPNALTFDNRDDPLNASKGWQLRAGIEPFYDVLGESDPFTKLEAGARTYIKFDDQSNLILAVRGNVGSILGGSTDDIPATERFYAGGGGTIRGFGYQEVGPFENGDPSGGRSIVTGSTELRLKFTDTFGGVAFIDGGSVSDSVSPDFDNLSFGAGLGVRYYTDFGPLRFDIAVPLNQKNELDQNYQFYISIGQAF